MTGLWLYVRRDLARRWRPIVVLGLLAGLAGGLAVAAFTGALRSRVVIDEALRTGREPDASVLPSRPGFRWDDIVRLPEVEAYSLFAVGGFCIAEFGGLEAPESESLCSFPDVGGDTYESIQRVEIVEGRMFDRAAPSEIMVNERAADAFGIEVGDALHLETLSPAQTDVFLGVDTTSDFSELPPGPVVPVRVVAVGSDQSLVWGRLIQGGVASPGFVATPALLAAHEGEIGYAPNAIVRLRNGADDLDSFRTGVIRLTGDESIPIRDLSQDVARVERSTTLESGALTLFGVAVLAAAAVLVGQALIRLVRSGAADAPVLRSIGVAPREAAIALAAPGLLAAQVGAAITAIVGVLLTPLFPIGVARSFESESGIRLEPRVLLAGVLLILITLGAGSLFAARGTVRGLGGTPSPPSAVGRRLARLGLALPVELGSRLALQRGPVGEPAPVRPALVGAVVGVLAVTAAFTFRDGLDDAVSRPERGGLTWDLIVDAPLDDVPPDPDIARAGAVTRAETELDGLPVPAYAEAPGAVPLARVVMEGRLPRTSDEATVGPATARKLGLDVGDVVAAGSGTPRAVKVVGMGFLPEFEGHSAYDQGMWVTPAGLKRLQPPRIDWTWTFVDGRDGIDPDALAGRLTEQGLRVEPPVEPAGVTNLRGVRSLPVALGGFLALLAIGAVGHAVVSTVRRRRRDFAVLRTLGMTRGQVRGIVAWQSTTLAVLGLVVGVPLGMATGRWLWRWVAESTPLVYAAPLALIALLLVIPAALVAVNGVALGPARAAVRPHPAVVLRAE